MYNTIFTLLFFALLNFSLHSIDRATWQKACAQLPKNIDVTKDIYQSGFSLLSNPTDTQDATWQEVNNSLSSVLNLYKHQLEDPTNWTNKSINGSYVQDQKERFYAEKLSLHEKDRVVFHGDFHGDIHSLHQELEQLEQQGILKQGSFELADKNCYLAFLGDYVDRGNYGLEVLYTLFRLKMANPHNVVIVRGNHEDLQICNHYGFQNEFEKKCGKDKERYKKIAQFYALLPVVAYIGHENNYLQCCHGGLEYGYKPGKLLDSDARYDNIGELKRAEFKTFLDKHPQHQHNCCCNNHTKNQSHSHKPWQEDTQAFANYTPNRPIDSHRSLGFMWADFIKFGFSYFNQGRGLAANENLTKAVLDYQNQDSIKQIKGIFRAHQHAGHADAKDASNLMSELIASNGVYNMWRAIKTDQERSLKDGIVWTFNTGPDGVYNKNLKYGFDAYAILQVAHDYENWRLKVCNPQIIDRPGYTQPCS